MSEPTSLPIRFIGVDAARSGGDESVILVLRQMGFRYAVEYVKGWHNQDAITLARKVLKVHEALPGARIGIDVIGVGAGVYDIVRSKLGRLVYAYTASNKVIGDELDKKRFANLKAQAFHELSEAMSRGEVAIPDHEALVEQLIAMQADRDQHGKMRVVDPEDSPDYADALVIAYASATIIKSRVWVGT